MWQRWLAGIGCFSRKEQIGLTARYCELDTTHSANQILFKESVNNVRADGRGESDMSSIVVILNKDLTQFKAGEG